MNFFKKATAGLVILIITSFSVHAQEIRGNGKVVKQSRDVAPFTAINTTDGWDLVLTQGNEYAMTIETDENLVDIVQTEVRNGVLYIFSNTRIRESRERNIHLTFRELNGITASDGSDIIAKTPISAGRFELDLQDGSDLDRLRLSAEELTARFADGSDAKIRFESIGRIEVEANDGSDIELRGIDGASSRISLAEGSDAVLEGATGQLTMNASGGSDVDASDLEVRDATLELSGSSDVTITVTGTIDFNLNGGSDLSVRGNPAIRNYKKCKSCDLDLQ